MWGISKKPNVRNEKCGIKKWDVRNMKPEMRNCIWEIKCEKCEMRCGKCEMRNVKHEK